MKTGYDKFFINAKNNARGGVKLNLPQENRQEALSKSINVEKLKKSIRTSQQEKQSKKRKFPVVQFSMFIACLGLMFFLVEKYEDIEKFIGKIEVGLNSASAETAAAPVAAAAPAAEHKAEGEGGAEGEHKPVASMKLDESDYLFKMADRKKELDEREEELNKKSEEIAKQKVEIEEKLKQLEDYRSQITNMLKERIATDASKVETLVQVYSNMKPSQAAQIFENLDEDLVVEILGKMKKKSAADILNLVKADKAKILSEKYAGYRAPASATNNTNNKEVEK